MNKLFNISNAEKIKDGFILVKEGENFVAKNPTELLEWVKCAMNETAASNNDMQKKMAELLEEHERLKFKLRRLELLNAYNRLLTDISLGLVEEPSNFEEYIQFLDSGYFSENEIPETLGLLKEYDREVM